MFFDKVINTQNKYTHTFFNDDFGIILGLRILNLKSSPNRRGRACSAAIPPAAPAPPPAPRP